MSLSLCKMEAMNKKNAQSKVKSWLSQTGVDDPPLLKTKADGRTVVIQNHTGHGKMVTRSDELSQKINEVSELIKKAFNQAIEQGLPKCPIEGIVYTIYQREPGTGPTDPDSITPIYVGIARSTGKSGKVSSLFNSGWGRFADTPNSNGHIGNINEQLQNREDSKNNYRDWVDTLFTDDSDLEWEVILRKPVFVRIEVWDSNSSSIINELGHTPLEVEEMLKIWLVNIGGKGDSLLNKDGNRF